MSEHFVTKHWVIKTEHGYKLEDYFGYYLKWFDMAADCKAYCMESVGVVTVLKKGKTPIQDVHYNWATGKDLWWQGE